MRLRRKPLAKKMVQEHPLVVSEPERIKGYWKNLFRNSSPVYVELGTGKGQYLARSCQNHPNINWIGVEKIEEVLLQACQKAEEIHCANLRFIWMDIQQLNQVFAAKEVDRILLHFSDPWPKKRHAKRRLTHRNFLKSYQQILKPEGELRLKTDNEPLFRFTQEELMHCGYHVIESSSDLHHSSFAKSNVMTEYEEKFSSLGMPIYYLAARPPSKD